MRKIFSYGWEILKLSWHANGMLSILALISKVYENTLFPFLQVFLLAKVLDLIQKSQGIQINDILPFAIAYIIFASLNVILTSYSNLQGFYLDASFETYLDRMVIAKLTTLDPATFEKPAFQELVAQVEGVKGLMSAQLERLIGFLDAIAKILTASLVLYTFLPWFIPLVLFSVLPSYYFGDVARKKGWPFFTEKRSFILRLTNYVKNLLAQDSTSKEAAIFKTGKILQHKVKTEHTKYLRDYKKVNDPSTRNIIISNLLQLAIFFYTQSYNVLAVMKGTLGVGAFALAFQQTLNLAKGSQQLLDMYSSMMNRIQQIDSFFTFLHYQPMITSPLHPVAISTQPKPPVIEFKNVSFNYPGTDRAILKNFSLTIQSGEKIALVGENGAGKTTLIKLLLRFYDVSKGDLLINNTNIKDLDLEEWHTQVGALFQDFIKYQFTFKENIFFGNVSEKNNEELLKAAIAKSGAEKFLHTLPDGINQVVGKMFEGGIDLSGGQWQKLALSRAFFRNAPVLILDEPTSAIDAKAEYEIFENVQKLQQDKTVIIISHRFSTVRNADRILVLNDGEIIEEGNHQHLMQKNGLYAELFNIQAQGYK